MIRFSVFKCVAVTSIILLGLIVASPNILPQNLLKFFPYWFVKLQLPMGIDLRGGSRLVVQFEDEATAKRSIDATIEIMKRRLQNSGYNPSDFIVVPQAKDRIRVEVPRLFNVQILKNIVSVTGNLAFYIEDSTVSANQTIRGEKKLPPQDLLLYSLDDPPKGYVVNNKPLLTNENFAGAVAQRLDQSGDFATDVQLDAMGREKLISFSTDHPAMRLVAVFDGEVVMPILQGSLRDKSLLSIEPLDEDVAKNLANVLSIGPLPHDVKLIEERTIGADLGEDFASAGLMAAFGAILVIMIFMMFAYGVMGLVANIALTLNLILLIGCLSLAGAPLTLAGFAGLVLIIGISVDANILIFERIREERRYGLSLMQSIVMGFKNALATIVDADFTTLIAVVVLFLLGVGPIHGFALVVSFGIFTSLFTTFLVTPLLLQLWVKYLRPRELSWGLLRLISANSTIRFMHIKAFTLSAALLLIIATIGLYATVGVNYGIDFRGGSLALLEAKNGQVNIEDIKDRVQNLNMGDVKVEHVNTSSGASLLIPSQQYGDSSEQAVSAKLRSEFSKDYRVERMDVVGSTVSSQLTEASLFAIVVSLAAIFFYVTIRFSWKFAVGAVLTTIHDAIVLIGVFVFTDWQFNLWSAAALLAVIGYSLNDTIVIYDRVRTLLAHHGNFKLSLLVDLAINRTLSRTVMTSLATLIAHIPLYYFGTDDMRNFASVLLLGIVIGTYSSIFIAGPLLVVLRIGQPESKINSFKVW